MNKGSLKRCPKCYCPNAKTTDSRVRESEFVARRKLCPNCKHRWSTIEVPFEVWRSVDADAHKKAADRLRAMADEIERIT